jgi:ABC-type polysaccharide/polyol phosphate export permease
MLPAGLRWAADANPMAVVITAFRAALFGRPFNAPALAAAAIFTLLLLGISTMVFRTMEEQFADLV